MKKLGILLFFTLTVSVVLAAGKGKIGGIVVDAQTGEALIGANVYLEGHPLGAASDLEGSYLILNVPENRYTLIVSVVGYAELKINNVEVKANEITQLNLSVNPEILSTETVVVEAKALKNTESALLKSRQKSAAVSDAVSAEAISQAGSGNAAEAMKQITGASVVDGKHIYVRGLGDRYTSAQLNGAELPSTDPYRRSGSIDLIPTNLVDNIVTVKSFTPDKPGNFSGGAVNINTKDFPEKLQYKLSIGSSYNSQVHFKDDVIGYVGSSTDWLGYDNGLRALSTSIPKEITGDADAITRAQMTKSFSKAIAPEKVSYPVNQSISLSLGNQIQFLDRPLGFLASFSYKRDFSAYSDGEYKRWQGTENIMALDLDYSDSRSKEEVLWGALAKISYKLTPQHIISFNSMYNQNGENESKLLVGRNYYRADEKTKYHQSALSYKERSLYSFQLEGKHHFNSVNLNWKASTGSMTQDEPDVRHFRYLSGQINGETYYQIETNDKIKRYFRTLTEDRNNYALDLSIPFTQWTNNKATVKLGAFASIKKRNFLEREFSFNIDPNLKFDGNANNLLTDENTDASIITINDVDYTSNGAVYVSEIIKPVNNYNAGEDIYAGYAMVDIPLTYRWRFIGGVRYETSDIYVETLDDALNGKPIQTSDALPSVNLIYNVIDNMNIRTSYSKTVARPTFREIALYESFDHIGGDEFVGDTLIQRTLIDNIDLRWEWFSKPGEIYAVSLFYKNFKNPIEQKILTYLDGGKVRYSWGNVNEAFAYGIELELRKNLGVLSPSLNRFSAGANLSFIESGVNISKEELERIREGNPNASDTRPFQGQSPYLFNFSLNYANVDLGMAASLYYNVFGERLAAVSYGKTPDVYEKPYHLLNLNYSWDLLKSLTFNFGVKNILNSKQEKIHNFQGAEYTYSLYRTGRSFSIGLSYKL
jgi:TonB-dependent receptor